ncbi:SirB1 family protein [Azospirillum picis]|uniref:Regulator of sirC expression with transglutaminase-like and TPR domain n=1 Tax=Azospirillum picis TaxID=488438 RepID=A0ABU0MLI0_9PROT|nr:transglutaminase-like domain-containing protein [Azospirillum picis]MBP2300297.1 regulator of sirC expression with transglutaminase-like and TPR domain [Azospirillum picis]MDQ0534093.1 regulator of sirC expression with transglutaminase-like and TPR domain [Azospirillum picis]
MSNRAEAREILSRIGDQPDDEIDMAEAALALGALEHPNADLAPYRAHLQALKDDLAARVAAGAGADAGADDGLEARIAHLHAVIGDRHGYSGDHDTYDDLQNANLLRVIDRRRGLPVALGILYMHLARSQDWPMVGLNFPGHFLVRIEKDGARAILDPFNDGQTRSVVDLRDLLKATAGSAAELEPGHYRPVSNRDVLLRLQNNIKLRHLSAHEVPKALEVLEAMRLFAPHEPSLWRETGLLEAHAGKLKDAVTALETFMALTGDEGQRHQTAALIQQLKNRLN